MKISSQGPGHYLGAAAIPLPAKLAQAYQSHAAVAGSPGTDPIPSPRPGAVPQGVRYNRGGGYHRSDQAPEVWFPGIYYYGSDSMQTPGQVSYLSDNQLPMPAIDPKGLPNPTAVRPTFMGQTQIRQPAQTVQFPTRFG